jgi:predicted DNA binding CopG/RHH family protein
MTGRRWDSLLEKDWGDDWASLPIAPEFPNKPKSAQITLRLPGVVLDRIKKVSSARSLPYHALARSWIADGLREPSRDLSKVSAEPQNEQLNIKLDDGLLDDLKRRAHDLGHPYHRLAREWIEAALAREEASLGLDPVPNPGPAMVDVMLLLLHSPNSRGQDAVRGISQLQKLLFVIEQKLTAGMGFYAYNFGPFNEKVNDAAEALQVAGFMHGGTAGSPSPPTFAEMMAVVVERARPASEHNTPEVFALNREGHARAERLLKSNRAYEQLYRYVSALRREWDTPDLVARVYDAFPKYTERSLIKDKIARRRRSRSTE